MLPEAVAQSLLDTAESQVLERKVACPKPAELRAALCAFANATPEGEYGTLLIGVEDNGTIKGVPSSDLESVQQTILKAGREDCYPPIHAVTQVVRRNDKSVILVLIHFSKDRPHFTGHAYLRVGPRSEKASASQFEELILSRTDKLRRLLRLRDKPLTLQLRVPANSDLHFHTKYLHYKGKTVTVTSCNCDVVSLRCQDTDEALFLPVSTIQLSYDSALNRPKLIVGMEDFDHA